MDLKAKIGGRYQGQDWKEIPRPRLEGDTKDFGIDLQYRQGLIPLPKAKIGGRYQGQDWKEIPRPRLEGDTKDFGIDLQYRQGLIPLPKAKIGMRYQSLSHSNLGLWYRQG